MISVYNLYQIIPAFFNVLLCVLDQALFRSVYSVILLNGILAFSFQIEGHLKYIVMNCIAFLEFGTEKLREMLSKLELEVTFHKALIEKKSFKNPQEISRLVNTFMCLASKFYLFILFSHIYTVACQTHPALVKYCRMPGRRGLQ